MCRVGSSTGRTPPRPHDPAASRSRKKKGDFDRMLMLQTMGGFRLLMASKRRTIVRTQPRAVLSLLALLLLEGAARPDKPEATPLVTVAEKTDYRATSRHADVVEFCERLAKLSPLVRLGTLGTSQEGRKLPLVIVADPPVATAAEAQKSRKLIVFTMGNIHAGE